MEACKPRVKKKIGGTAASFSSSSSSSGAALRRSGGSLNKSVSSTGGGTTPRVTRGGFKNLRSIFIDLCRQHHKEVTFNDVEFEKDDFTMATGNKKAISLSKAKRKLLRKRAQELNLKEHDDKHLYTAETLKYSPIPPRKARTDVCHNVTSSFFASPVTLSIWINSSLSRFLFRSLNATF